MVLLQRVLYINVSLSHWPARTMLFWGKKQSIFQVTDGLTDGWKSPLNSVLAACHCLYDSQ